MYPIDNVTTPTDKPSRTSPKINSGTEMISANTNGKIIDVRIILLILHTPITLHKSPIIKIYGIPINIIPTIEYEINAPRISGKLSTPGKNQIGNVSSGKMNGKNKEIRKYFT